MRIALLLLLSVAPIHAEEVKLVLWNSDTLFDRDVVNQRVFDLQAFRRHFQNVDIVMLNEVGSFPVVQAIRDRMGLTGFHVACSDFAQDDFDTYNSLEVGLISKFPLANIVEFDWTPDNRRRAGEPAEKRLVDTGAADISDIEEAQGMRGFLTADVPALGLTLVITHLKSSRGNAGEADWNHAKQREFVAAAISDFVARKLKSEPAATILVAGDMNVGETDMAKVGFRLDQDQFNRSEGDLYDDTHAIFSAGLVDHLRMASLTKALGTETYDSPRFAGVGPIDCLYVVGRQASDFTLATRSPKTFGSDHFAVSTRFLFNGTVPQSVKIDSDGNSRSPTLPADKGLQISALLPNPAGQDEGQEWVKLTNTSSKTIALAGWQLRDKAGHPVVLVGEIAAGAELVVRLAPDQMPLNNSGETVELINAKGQIVHRVRYSSGQASPGREIKIGP